MIRFAPSKGGKHGRDERSRSHGGGHRAGHLVSVSPPRHSPTRLCSCCQGDVCRYRTPSPESSPGRRSPDGHALRLEDIACTLASQTTLGPLLESIRSIAHTDAELCCGVLAALSQTPSVAGVPLDVEATAAVSASVAQHLGMEVTLPLTVRMELRGDEAETASRESPTKQEGERPGRVGEAIATAVTTGIPPDEGLPLFPRGLPGGLRHRIFVLFDDPEASLVGKLITTIVLLAIMVSTISFVLESLPALRQRPAACAELRAAGLPLTALACEPVPWEAFGVVEAVCIAIFSLDYVVRVATAHAARDAKRTSALGATFSYVRQPLAIVDLAAIVPFYVDLVIGGGAAGFAKILRLCRILRLLKLAGRSPMVMMYWQVLVMSGQPLLIVSFFNLIVVVLFACLIYYAEGQSYSVDDSIVDMFPTVTTVGYGDMTPTTPAGKATGVACFYVGIIFLALPISILGQNFNIIYERFLEGKKSSMFSSRFSKFSSRSRTTDSLTSFRKTPQCRPSESWRPVARGWRRGLFLLLEDPRSCRLAKWVSMMVLLTIFVSTIVMVMESMPDLRETPEACLAAKFLTVENCEPRPHDIFKTVEVVCVTIFTVEYILRVGTVHAAKPQDCGLTEGRSYNSLEMTVCYARQLLNLVDLFAILPFYAEVAGLGSGGASVLRVLRLVRIFRVLKIPKLKSCADMLVDVCWDALPALLILLFMSMMACVFFASCIYITEGTRYSVEAEVLEMHPNGAYIRPSPDGYGIEVSPFTSIPYAFWWFFTTATTVGYGDDFPTTTAGRLVGVLVFCTGIILLAMPITIVGGSFSKYYEVWVKEFGDRPEPQQETEGEAEVITEAAKPPADDLAEFSEPQDSEVAISGPKVAWTTCAGQRPRSTEHIGKSA